jgi:hypothetical protein
VVQIWPGQTVTCLHTNSPGHIWTTLYLPESHFSQSTTAHSHAKQPIEWAITCDQKNGLSRQFEYSCLLRCYAVSIGKELRRFEGPQCLSLHSQANFLSVCKRPVTFHISWFHLTHFMCSVRTVNSRLRAGRYPNLFTRIRSYLNEIWGSQNRVVANDSSLLGYEAVQIGIQLDISEKLAVFIYSAVQGSSNPQPSALCYKPRALNQEVFTYIYKSCFHSRHVIKSVVFSYCW